MGKSENPSTITTNAYSEHFTEFQESELFRRLEKKFAPLPYFKQFRPLQRVAMFASYLFNCFSALTASVLVFFFVEAMTGSRAASVVVTLAALALLEIGKRKTGSLFFKDFLQYRKAGIGLASILLVLVGISVMASYFGGKKLVTEFTPPPALEDATEKTETLRGQIATIDGQIEKHMANKNHLGQVFIRSQRAAERLTKQKEMLLAQWMETEKRTATANLSTATEHRQLTELKAEHFAAITFLLEVLFLLCAWYLEYFDFRSFAELVRANHTANDDMGGFAYTKHHSRLQLPGNGKGKEAATAPDDRVKAPAMAVNDHKLNGHNGTNRDAVLKAIKHVRGRIASANYRIRNNIGRKETSQENIRRHTAELEELQTMLA